MKNFNNLNNEELKKVWENNSKLRQRVFEDMQDAAGYWCGEYLECWDCGAIDYSIGYDRGSYFRYVRMSKFIEGLERAQKDYCFLSDEHNAVIAYCRKLYDKQDELYNNGDYINGDRVIERLEELLKELESECFKRFMSEYEATFDEEAQLDYFIDFYYHERMNDNFYLDEDFKLYERITKCYA